MHFLLNFIIFDNRIRQTYSHQFYKLPIFFNMIKPLKCLTSILIENSASGISEQINSRTYQQYSIQSKSDFFLFY